ncbi:MAG: hypothetical protein H8K08_10645 [Nitrospira sp.]|nr:hypothetical protein [Nitrospira sp.]
MFKQPSLFEISMSLSDKPKSTVDFHIRHRGGIQLAACFKDSFCAKPMVEGSEIEPEGQGNSIHANHFQGRPLTARQGSIGEQVPQFEPQRGHDCMRSAPAKIV